MPVTSITVEFEKRSNDGDYGSELSKAVMHYELADGEDPVAVVAALQGQLRGRVESDLAQSVNLKVRRSLIRQVRRCNRCSEPLPDEESGYLHAACREADDAERQARYEEQRRKQDRDQLVGVGADDDDDEDVPL